MPMDKTLSEAIAVCIRLNMAQNAYRVDENNEEVGLTELNAAFEAFEAFTAGLQAGEFRVDLDLAQAVAIETTTGKKNRYIQHDEEGSPVALQCPMKLTVEQLARAQELLADPRQTITGAAKELGVSRDIIYSEVPGAKGRPLGYRAGAS